MKGSVEWMKAGVDEGLAGKEQEYEGLGKINLMARILYLCTLFPSAEL